MVAGDARTRGHKLLWLLRHAKTIADPPPGGTDHERVLTPGGRRDAEALGRRLLGDRLGFDREQLPQLVLCSTAQRAVETAEGALFGLPAPLDLRHSLYRATPEEVVDEVRTVDEEVTSVVVVGHNPTIGRLAVAMVDADDEAGRRALATKTFPTCALAVYALAASRWAEAAEGTGALIGRWAPPFE